MWQQVHFQKLVTVFRWQDRMAVNIRNRTTLGGLSGSIYRLSVSLCSLNWHSCNVDRESCRHDTNEGIHRYPLCEWTLRWPKACTSSATFVWFGDKAGRRPGTSSDRRRPSPSMMRIIVFEFSSKLYISSK